MDGSHTHTDTIRYARPVFWLAAWWTPLIFAMGSLTTGLSRPLAEVIFKRPSTKASLGQVAFANAIFYSGYVASGYFPGSPAVKTALLLGMWAVLWLSIDRTFLGFALSVLPAVWGPLLERGLSELGWFHYVRPDFFGVMSWLPALYALAALGSGYLGKALVEGLRENPA